MSAIKPLIFALLTVTACASNPAPRGALPGEEDVDRNGYGGWIYVERNSGPVVQGELLAASEDSVVILTASGVQVVERAAIRLAEVGVFQARLRGLTTWTVLGTLSTISNGRFLLLSAPMWLIGGGFMLARVSRQPIYDWRSRDPQHDRNDDESLASFARFARFPAGIPETVDRSTLTSPMLKQER